MYRGKKQTNKTKQTNKKQKDTWRTPCTSKYNREKLSKKAYHNYDELLAQVSQQKLFKHTQTLLCLYSHGYLMQSRTVCNRHPRMSHEREIFGAFVCDPPPPSPPLPPASSQLAYPLSPSVSPLSFSFYGDHRSSGTILSTRQKLVYSEF